MAKSYKEASEQLNRGQYMQMCKFAAHQQYGKNSYCTLPSLTFRYCLTENMIKLVPCPDSIPETYIERFSITCDLV